MPRDNDFLAEHFKALLEQNANLTTSVLSEVRLTSESISEIKGGVKDLKKEVDDLTTIIKKGNSQHPPLLKRVSSLEKDVTLHNLEREHREKEKEKAAMIAEIRQKMNSVSNEEDDEDDKKVEIEKFKHKKEAIVAVIIAVIGALSAAATHYFTK